MCNVSHFDREVSALYNPQFRDSRREKYSKFDVIAILALFAAQTHTSLSVG